MLFTNRRHQLMFIALSGMDVAWFLPLAFLLINSWQRFMLDDPLMAEAATRLDRLLTLPPLVAFIFFWGILLFYMLVADLINVRQVMSPQREIYLLAFVLGTTFLSVRLLLYPEDGLFDLRFLRNTFRSVFNISTGRSPELAIILFNLFFWFRTGMMSNRPITFLSVGMTFRLGLLLALIGNFLLTMWTGLPTATAVVFFWLFLGFGLASVALARIDEKSLVGESSAGAVMPWSRAGLLLVAIVLVLGVALLLSPVYTPDNIRTAIGWFWPLWLVLGWVMTQLLAVAVWLLTPLMDWMIRVLQDAMADFDFDQLAQNQPNTQGQDATEYVDFSQMVNEFTFLRYCLMTFIIVGVLFVLWVIFARIHRRQRTDETERDDAESLDMGGNPLRDGWNRLKNLADLLRRYGLSNQLLDAISIENIYANLSRMARQRGYPRHPSQPPDEYLPQLLLAFPAQEAALGRITSAYMRVHYGDRPVPNDELERLRDDYESVRAVARTDGNDERDAASNNEQDE